MNRPFQKYQKRAVDSVAHRNARQQRQKAPSHISRTEWARWFNRTTSPVEKRKIERHFLSCRVCQHQITLKQLAEIAAEAKKQMAAAVRAAERN